MPDTNTEATLPVHRWWHRLTHGVRRHWAHGQMTCRKCGRVRDMNTREWFDGR